MGKYDEVLSTRNKSKRLNGAKSESKKSSHALSRYYGSMFGGKRLQEQWPAIWRARDDLDISSQGFSAMCKRKVMADW